MTELEMIKKQFIEFNTYKSNISSVFDYIPPKIQQNCIGEKTSKFTMNNYIDRYREILKENHYQIILQDESLISFYYKFDAEQNVTQYNLSYIPSVDIDINIDDYDHKDKNTMLLLIDSFTDYIRIDFDKEGYEEIIHCENHAHIGLKKRRHKSDFRQEIRFPVKHVIYPYDFIYIICKYIYQVSDEDLNELINVNVRRGTLNEKEKRLLNVGIS